MSPAATQVTAQVGLIGIGGDRKVESIRGGGDVRGGPKAAKFRSEVAAEVCKTMTSQRDRPLRQGKGSGMFLIDSRW